ncbi:MAG: hypothetical protein OEV41_08950 [Gammaproteobacteria bacterium]|nr:hypothetical protein [Gammaproteobacteria bacterium]MDH5345231.1 hypothetical protein [Gammaproteobacteria bacterium]
MKNFFCIMLLAALQCACAVSPAEPPQKALLTFDDLAREITVARVGYVRKAARDDQGPLGTP